LKQLAKTTKLHGFRPGKVPLKIVEQKYGAQIHQDVLGDIIQKEFNETVKSLDLKIAGYPDFQAKETSEDVNDLYTFSATFEVYPEIILGDLSQHSVEKPIVQVSDADIDKTIEMIRKQQVQFQPVGRPAKTDDRVKIDFHGVLDGKDFAGGKAENVELVIGEGKFLKDFENALIDLDIAQEKSFDVTFPEEYHSKDMAGKTVTFTVKLHEINMPVLPEVNAEFAKLLGIPDGDLEKVRVGIRQDLEREVLKRTRSKLKEQVMQCFLDTTQIEAPNVLVDQETERLMKEASENFESRGMKAKDIQLSPEMFKDKADNRIKLGLILAELVKVHDLKATPEKVRSIIEEMAQNYDNPEQVVKWHYASAERLKEIQSLALEDNVVLWALEKVKMVDKAVTFDEMMGIS
ncbi:MAG: trigger factor, partial [Betaproteobacteria bacterium]|nr:trigger factor [Betaproteobacteria bacterium]